MPGAAVRQVRLVPVDSSNRDAVLAIRVREDQTQLVAPNSKSLRQAAEEPSLLPRVLVDREEVIGFGMWQRRPDGSAYIWRVMIAATHQGRGLGRRLMELLLDEIKREGPRKVFISHRPHNRAAEHLFESFGFEEHDVEPDGEVVRLLRWDP